LGIIRSSSDDDYQVAFSPIWHPRSMLVNDDAST